LQRELQDELVHDSYKSEETAGADALPGLRRRV
jgi:hypothetical protein